MCYYKQRNKLVSEQYHEFELYHSLCSVMYIKINIAWII